MFKKELLLILLLATVLIYCAAVYWSILDYEEWKKAELKYRPWAVFDPYIISGRGILMIVLSAKLRIAALATVVIADAVYPLVYAAYKISYLGEQTLIKMKSS